MIIKKTVHTFGMNGFFDKNFFNKNGKKYLMYLGIAVGIWFSFRYLLPLIMPLVLAAAFVVPSASLLHLVSKRLHMGKGMLAGALLTFLVSVLFGAVWFILVGVFQGISSVIQNLDQIMEGISHVALDVCGKVEGQLGMRQGELWIMVEEKGTDVMHRLQEELLPKVMSGSMQYIKVVVAAITFFLITFVSAVLLAKDYEAVKQTVFRIPECKKGMEITKKIGEWMKGYLKAQFMVMLAIFAICIIAFWIVGLPHGFQTGIITGLLDVLPFIGAGIVLWPLAAWYCLTKAYWKAAVILLTYFICVFVREFLEPRLLGKSTNFLPVFMLASMYGGVKLYGIMGVILGPLSVLLFREIAFSIGKSVDKEQGKF